MKSIRAVMMMGLLWGGAALAAKGEADMRGLTVSVGGGVEGYSGELAPRLDAGATYGATLTAKPSRVLGFELGYTGAVNTIDLGAGSSAATNPQLVRNGGQAVATLGLTASPIQPYILGGVGVNRYNVRKGGDALGYRDDTAGAIPMGAGVRFYSGSIVADLRGSYNLLFSEEFAPESRINTDPNNTNFASGGTFNGTLNVGATW
ncbi:hypothetical protein JY651_10685 [Pyxidicoccus parkwayensis]|uniref:Outer membrane protein beta-barrel domain-containing protein n=1 Tax=Pyxidicoccus parkwayensis TaxID=2813578 RepID=A0ABX7P4D5_9BACT|nr:hypothetical protein [Pyxidicoccus parkwaysis]QSQ25354.1 hypothetical protein JY651_10685 [Pyxidicoccus parkwaysis]